MILNASITKDIGMLHYIQDFMDLGTFLNTAAPTLLHFPRKDNTAEFSVPPPSNFNQNSFIFVLFCFLIKA